MELFGRPGVDPSLVLTSRVILGCPITCHLLNKDNNTDPQTFCEGEVGQSKALVECAVPAMEPAFCKH